MVGSFFLLLIVPFASCGSPNIGKDSDYPGGTDRRKLDKWAQEHLPHGRANKLVMAGHMVEHAGRAAYAAVNGKLGTACGELDRAVQNFPGFVQPGIFGAIDLLFVPGNPGHYHL